LHRIFGYVIASVVYYGLNYISPQTVSLVDVATYPLKLGETYTPPTAESDGASDSDVKDPTVTREKEVV
jgi:hypothetical protein